jgi:hypothetical protein
MTDEHTIVYKGQFSVLHLMKSAYNLNLYKRATVHKGCIFRLPSERDMLNYVFLGCQGEIHLIFLFLECQGRH